MSGEDKRIRSSFTVTDVLGQMDTGTIMETLERKCSAGILNVDASSEYYDLRALHGYGTISRVLHLNIH